MKEYKAPDIKGPRYRPEVHTILNKEFFDNFKKMYPKYKSIDNILLRKVVKKFNQLVFQTVIDTRDGVQLPEQLGWLFIGTCDTSKKDNIDFAKSKKYGMLVNNNNWETDGKLAKIFFTNFAPKHKMRNREFWGFVACREFKRTVAKSYPENWNKYIQVVPRAKINKDYSNAIYKEHLNKVTKKALESYNEFEV